MPPSAAPGVPGWLAPHLREGEAVRWSEAPGPGRWRGAALALAGAAAVAVFAADQSPRWWTYLIPSRARTGLVPPWLTAILAGVAFLAAAGQGVVRAAFTAYAVTDRRLLVVTRVGKGLVDGHDLARVEVLEVDRDRKRPRVRLRVPGGGRNGRRFRIRPADAQALLAALRLGGAKGA